MKDSRGFTLIELMITLAVIAIGLTLVSAGVQQFVRFNRDVSQTNSLVATLQLARSEAIKRNTNVYACASSSTTASSPKCDSNSWQNGWIVFADPTHDAVDTAGAFSGTPPDTNDVVIQLGQGLKGGTTIQSTSFAHSNYIRYDSTGRSDSSGSFVICDSKKDLNRARAINISITGLVSLAEDTDTTKDYIVNLPDGSNVSCP